MSSPSFESLRVWHNARHLTARIYSLTREAPFANDYALSLQIRRAAISVMSNIAEGYERGRTREFVHFLRIAKGSAAEIRAQIYAAHDIGYIDESAARELRRESICISKQIAALVEAATERVS